MVDPEPPVGFDVVGVGDAGSGEVDEVLEGVEAAAEGEGRQPCADEVHSGAKDERGELRSVQGASEWEEDEELERRDQMEANHLVLSLCDYHLPCCLRRSSLSGFQAHSLHLLSYLRLLSSSLFFIKNVQVNLAQMSL